VATKWSNNVILAVGTFVELVSLAQAAFAAAGRSARCGLPGCLFDLADRERQTAGHYQTVRALKDLINMFRRIAIASLTLVSCSLPAMADDIVAAKPGLICISSDALAHLTLPDGSSRTAQPNPSPADLALKQSGGCSDITIGMRVTVQNARHNTSIVTYAPPGGQAITAYVPNIDFSAAPEGGDSSAPSATPASDDSAADNKIDQAVSAPGGSTNFYILTLSGQDSAGDPNMEIQATYNNNASRVTLVINQPANDAEQNLSDFSNLFLSPDSKTLYFQSDAWATSPAIHSVDIASKKVSFMAAGSIACVVLAGQFQGDLIVQEHRYFVQGGSYDGLWLIDPAGKELGVVSLDTDSSKVCPLLSGP
jgi:hypothetical protein